MISNILSLTGLKRCVLAIAVAAMPFMTQAQYANGQSGSAVTVLDASAGPKTSRTSDDILGSYTGKVQPWKDTGDCRIEIKKLDNKTLQIQVDDTTFPPIAKKQLDQAIATGYMNQFEIWGPAGLVDFRHRYEWYMRGDLFETRHHDQNSGLLNFIYIQFQVVDRFCWFYNCTTELKQAECSVTYR